MLVIKFSNFQQVTQKDYQEIKRNSAQKLHFLVLLLYGNGCYSLFSFKDLYVFQVRKISINILYLWYIGKEFQFTTYKFTISMQLCCTTYDENYCNLMKRKSSMTSNT